jgi:hypothetical protein
LNRIVQVRQLLLLGRNFLLILRTILQLIVLQMVEL